MPLAQATPPPPSAPAVPSASRAAAQAPPTGDPGLAYSATLPSSSTYQQPSYPSYGSIPNNLTPGSYTPPSSFQGGGGQYANLGYGSYLDVSDPGQVALSNYLRAQYDNNLSSLQYQLSGLGIDAGYAERLMGLNSGWANEDYALTLQRIANAEQRDVTGGKADIAANRDYLNTLAGLLPQTRALNAQTRGNAYGRSQLDYDAQFRNSLSDASARGSVNSQGLRDTRDEIARQLGLGRESADIQFGRSSISATQDEAQLKRDKSLLDTKEKTLDTVAKDYGIDRRTAELALRQGLAKLGLDFDTAMQKINNASGETLTQLQQLQPMLWQQAMALAGQS